MPEDVLQSLLKICEKFINLSGVFNDSTTSTTYMKLMCKYCLPGEFKHIGHRHVQINKMILNIANCLGSNCILRKTCSARAAGPLCGKRWKTTQPTTTGTCWARRNCRLSAGLMCKSCIRAWTRFSLRVTSMKVSTC